MSESAEAVRTCEHCGFTWRTLTRSELATQMSRCVESFVEIMKAAGGSVDKRPSDQRWSILEYGGHLRDVIMSIRERVILASVLDMPTGTPIFRDERVNLGFYAQDSPADVAVELQVVTYLLLKTVATLPERFEDRTMIYSDRTPLEVTISGALLNALHECEHHLSDAAADLASLGSPPP